MDYKLDEYDLEEYLMKLNLDFPDEISFFPENLDRVDNYEDFIFTDTVIDLNRYLKREDIEVGFIGKDSENYLSRKSAEVYLPGIFISASVLFNNSNLISLLLNIISNYIYDHLKGNVGEKKANIDFYVELRDNKKVKRISYKGDADGLKNIEKIIKTLK